MWVSEYVSMDLWSGASLYGVWTSTLRWGGLKGVSKARVHRALK